MGRRARASVCWLALCLSGSSLVQACGDDDASLIPDLLDSGDRADGSTADGSAFDGGREGGQVPIDGTAPDVVVNEAGADADAGDDDGATDAGDAGDAGDSGEPVDAGDDGDAGDDAGDASAPEDAGPPPATYAVAGTVTGLTSGGLHLRNNGGDEIAVPANAKSFVFPAALLEGDTYDVTVSDEPTGPYQHCTVTKGSGTIGTSDVTDVEVRCVTMCLSVITTRKVVDAATLAPLVGLEVEYVMVGGGGGAGNIFSPADATPTSGTFTIATGNSISIVVGGGGGAGNAARAGGSAGGGGGAGHYGGGGGGGSIADGSGAGGGGGSSAIAAGDFLAVANGGPGRLGSGGSTAGGGGSATGGLGGSRFGTSGTATRGGRGGDATPGSGTGGGSGDFLNGGLGGLGSSTSPASGGGGGGGGYGGGGGDAAGASGTNGGSNGNNGGGAFGTRGVGAITFAGRQRFTLPTESGRGGSNMARSGGSAGLVIVRYPGPVCPL